MIIALLACSALVSANQDPSLDQACAELLDAYTERNHGSQAAATALRFMKKFRCDLSRLPMASTVKRLVDSLKEKPSCNQLLAIYLQKYQRWTETLSLNMPIEPTLEAVDALFALKAGLCDTQQIPIIDLPYGVIVPTEYQLKCYALVDRYLDEYDVWKRSQEVPEYKKAAKLFFRAMDYGCDVVHIPQLRPKPVHP